MIENSEIVILNKLTEAHNIFSNLEQTHPSDINEWANGIHQCQKIIMARIARRACPNIFPIKINKNDK